MLLNIIGEDVALLLCQWWRSAKPSAVGNGQEAFRHELAIGYQFKGVRDADSSSVARTSGTNHRSALANIIGMVLSLPSERRTGVMGFVLNSSSTWRKRVCWEATYTVPYVHLHEPLDSKVSTPDDRGAFFAAGGKGTAGRNGLMSMTRT
jgi:hypothetical protein